MHPDNDLRIRRAQPADAIPVLQLVPRLLSFGPPPWRNPREMGETDLAVIEEALASTGDDPVVYVAEKNHEVVGFIHLHSVEDYYRRLRHGHVADIVVAVSAEGQGIGKRLLAEGEAWARRLGFDWLSISVFEANRRAVTVYEGAGFQRDIMRLIKPLS